MSTVKGASIPQFVHFHVELPLDNTRLFSTSLLPPSLVPRLRVNYLVESLEEENGLASLLLSLSLPPHPTATLKFSDTLLKGNMVRFLPIWK